MTINEKNSEKCADKVKEYPCFIPAQRILNIISRKWSIQLIYILQGGKKIRYGDLKEQLQKGWKKDKISDATLSNRLANLTKEGIITREVYPELPPKVEYSLTEKGESLSKVIQPIVLWTIQLCHANVNKE